MKRFFEVFTNIIVKFFNLLSIVKFFKNFPIIVTKNNKVISQKNFYSVVENTNKEDLDDQGVVFKVSDDIVYAKGLLNVRMSEMVSFQVDNPLFGIVNYLDNEGVAGITVLGDASVITANT